MHFGKGEASGEATCPLTLSNSLVLQLLFAVTFRAVVKTA